MQEAILELLKIEISTRNTSSILSLNTKYERIKLGDNISSLSAVLLDNTYYEFLLDGQIEIDGISILDAAHLMPFKAKAYLDLCLQKENGVHIDSKNIKKHLNDFIRLYDYLDFSKSLSLSDDIANDMNLFLKELSSKEVNFNQFGVHVDSVEALIANLNAYFALA